MVYTKYQTVVLKTGCSNHIDMANSNPFDRTNCTHIDRANCNHIDRANSSPIDRTNSSPIDRTNSSPIDRANSSPIDRANCPVNAKQNSFNLIVSDQKNNFANSSFLTSEDVKSELEKYGVFYGVEFLKKMTLKLKTD
ncbi:hypothetical protein NGRA_1961 [Nosema granulosis]|uniref:Uncharacterized protein n=1 Tax=Nosema granulosis TaxID=83296 RepID=A0A9P6GY09_9MICR|nr:hypothetical protein NGRA_1961 [Nosema granulosis]